jgi:glycosyltransferase involved in cell wall biosynthesis
MPVPPTVTAIICALDEAPRIGGVLAVALSSGLFDTVLVVDDGSRDNTAKVAAEAGAAVVSHAKNLGKARAMQTGVNATSAPVICFLDADLTGISSQHLRQLVEPVINGAAQAALATFAGGRAVTTMAQKVAPMISGQRCLRRELLDDFERWDCGFGIETELNAHLLRKGIKQQIVEWQGAGQVMKEEKRGWVNGFGARLRMYRDIVRSWWRNR